MTAITQERPKTGRDDVNTDLSFTDRSLVDLADRARDSAINADPRSAREDELLRFVVDALSEKDSWRVFREVDQGHSSGRQCPALILCSENRVWMVDSNTDRTDDVVNPSYTGMFTKWPSAFQAIGMESSFINLLGVADAVLADNPPPEPQQPRRWAFWRSKDRV